MSCQRFSCSDPGAVVWASSSTSTTSGWRAKTAVRSISVRVAPRCSTTRRGTTSIPSSIAAVVGRPCGSTTPTPTPCALPVANGFLQAYQRAAFGCATTGAQVVWAAAEPFERGAMVWRSDTNKSYVFTLAGQWQMITAGWDGQSTASRGAPPAERGRGQRRQAGGPDLVAAPGAHPEPAPVDPVAPGADLRHLRQGRLLGAPHHLVGGRERRRHQLLHAPGRTGAGPPPSATPGAPRAEGGSAGSVRRPLQVLWRALPRGLRPRIRTHPQLAATAAGYLALRDIKPYPHVGVDGAHDLPQTQWRRRRGSVGGPRGV